jgi:predicted  nucleic acid-binding Zn-ribbon protein
MYADGSREILTGCTCGGRFFFFMKEKSIADARRLTKDLTANEKQQMERDALDMIGDRSKEEMRKDYPVVLDLESIRVRQPGKFEIDLVDLFRGEPLVYKLSDGKYIIDLASTFDAKKRE